MITPYSSAHQTHCYTEQGSTECEEKTDRTFSMTDGCLFSTASEMKQTAVLLLLSSPLLKRVFVEDRLFV